MLVKTYTNKMLRIPSPLKKSMEKICERKGITEVSFIMTAIDEKIRREKNDYREDS